MAKMFFRRRSLISAIFACALLIFAAAPAQ
jgi:hypothetical protein